MFDAGLQAAMDAHDELMMQDIQITVNDIFVEPQIDSATGQQVYPCPSCDKRYTGKHARSIWRRHLQDKHNIPLSVQPRRTRWDNVHDRPRTDEEKRQRTLESKRRWARKNRADKKAGRNGDSNLDMDDEPMISPVFGSQFESQPATPYTPPLSADSMSSFATLQDLGQVWPAQPMHLSFPPSSTLYHTLANRSWPAPTVERPLFVRAVSEPISELYDWPQALLPSFAELQTLPEVAETAENEADASSRPTISPKQCGHTMPVAPPSPRQARASSVPLENGNKTPRAKLASRSPPKTTTQAVMPAVKEGQEAALQLLALKASSSAPNSPPSDNLHEDNGYLDGLVLELHATTSKLRRSPRRKATFRADLSPIQTDDSPPRKRQRATKVTSSPPEIDFETPDKSMHSNFRAASTSYSPAYTEVGFQPFALNSSPASTVLRESSTSVPSLDADDSITEESEPIDGGHIFALSSPQHPDFSMNLGLVPAHSCAIHIADPFVSSPQGWKKLPDRRGSIQMQ